MTEILVAADVLSALRSGQLQGLVTQSWQTRPKFLPPASAALGQDAQPRWRRAANASSLFHLALSIPSSV